MIDRWPRISAAGMLLAFAFLLGNSPVPTVAASTVIISGRVLDSAGAGIPNVNVSAYQGGSGAVCCTWLTAVISDAAGNYSISIAPGTYRIQFYPADGSTFVSRWWSATGTARLFDGATDVSASGDAPLPDTTLETGFLISGTVTGSGGPLDGVNVSAYAAGTCCMWVGAGVTSTAGTYSFRVPIGSYRLQFYPAQSTTYIAQWWDGTASGARTSESGVDISVTADVAGKDAALTLGRRISGTITDGVNPIAGANASIYAGGAATCCSWIAGTRTDAAGAYSVIVPDGTYRLSFTGPSGSSYLAKWWDTGTGAGRFETAADIAVTADRTGMNGALPLGRRVSGRVTSDGTAGIAGAGVNAYTGGPTATCCTWIGGTSTDAAGSYSFVVPDGTYRFQFNAPGASSYVSNWWNGAAGAGRFDLASDVTIGGDVTMNSVLAAGVRISGRVTATDGTTGIGRVGVSANLGGTATCCSWVTGTGTDEQGNYSLVVPAGTYRFYYSAPRASAFIGQWWNGASGARNFDNASDVVVSAPTTGQNVRLVSGIRISGQITSNGTDGIGGAGVSAYNGGPTATCCTWAGGTGTASDGTYTLVVPAGTYRLYVGPPGGSSYMGQWSNGGSGVSRFDFAPDLDVSADVVGRNATLGTGVRISGTVTSNGTAGIGRVGVSAFIGGAGSACCTWVSGVQTDTLGAYTLVVPASATYRVQFSAPRSSSFLSKWWDGAAGASRFDLAADVPVSSATVPGIDAILATGRRITGRVTSDGTTGIANVGVSAFSGGSGATCCTWVNGTGTDGLGNYTLTVPDGTYRLQFYPPRGSQYMSQWWTNAGGATNFNAAADVPVASDVAGKDAQLTSGMRISGRVTSGGIGAPNVSVSAYLGGSAGCCTWVSGTGTDALGGYTLVVPPGGTYRLQFWPQRGSSSIGQWWTASGGASRFDLADNISVTADVTGRDVALQTGAHISGRVTNTAGAGVANANVQANVGGSGATCCTWVNGTGTDINGNYSLTVPTGASYRLRISAPSGSSYLSQWWASAGGVSNFNAADDTVVGTSDVTGRNATLATGVLISGTVRDQASVAIQGAWANAVVCSGGSCSGVAGASTDAAGVYVVAVPANATYKISFNAPFGSPYVGQWYNNAADPNTATAVVVSTSGVPNINATLATGFAITGTVSAGTAGVASANVNAYSCGTSGCQWVAGAQTASNGTYRMVVPSGSYKISFNPPYGSSYVGQWYSNAANSSTATPVGVTADLTGVDATLATGFAITGTMRTSAGAGVADANVSAQICGSNGGCQWVAGANTAADGTYRLIVPAGSYKISFNPPYGSSYVGQWYSNATGPNAATPVDVTTADRSGIDATLVPGSAISGTVGNGTSGIPNANVSAFTGCDTSGGCQWVAGTNTTSTGTYRLLVPAGTYKISFNPPQGSNYISQWYSNAAGPSTATAVVVSTSDVPNINATLATGFAITGTVRNGAAVGIANANVSAQICGSSGCQGVAGANTAADGTYRLLVPAGTYKISFNPPQGSSYVAQWYSNAANLSTATAVDVTTADRTGVDATLATGFAITGAITSNGATGIPNANVSAFTGCDTSGGCQGVAGANTAADGTYRLIVPAGSYKMRFNPPQGSSYISQWYSNAANPSTATAVVVSTSDVPNINATLAMGFAITGTVRNGAAVGIANANVSAQICGSSGCQGVAGANTAADGTYRLLVPAGTYKISFNPPQGSSYISQWYSNAADPNTATAVVVSTSDVPNINATLATGFAITGAITSNGTTGIPNANVSAFTGCDTSGGCQWVAGTNTTSTGTYRLVVPAGTYKIQIQGPQGSSYVTQWYLNATNPSAATPVDATAADRTGIDATLVSGFAITGTVRTSAGAGIPNANVNAQICGSSGCQWVAGTNTTSTGTYRLVVPGGTYQIQFNPPPGSSYVGQWYNNVATPSTATPVVVSTSDIPNINATLQ